MRLLNNICFFFGYSRNRFATKEGYHAALDQWLEDYPEDKEKIERLKDDSGLKEWCKAFGIEYEDSDKVEL